MDYLDAEEEPLDDFVHLDLLKKFWLDEKCAPSLLEYQERLMLHTNAAGVIIS